MEEYIVRAGKRLRLGYTTGSCAAAAAKAAAWMLLTGRRREQIGLTTPGGVRLELAVRAIELGAGQVSCAIEKDPGDDPDVTRGTLIFAAVSKRDGPGVWIDGGAGVGRVTRPGLDQPVGAAAINSVPRKMIRENVGEVCRALDYRGGLSVVISAPEGEALAKKTFNPRLGIAGGISILGTTGIVEPMSEQALVDTIRLELSQRRAGGAEYVLLTPGNYGAEFIRTSLGLDPERAVQTSNFIGESLDLCRELGFRGALLVGHIGKLVKLAGGIMNTHSRMADCRTELFCAHAALCGASQATCRALMDAATTDACLDILDAENLREPVLESLLQAIQLHLDRRVAGAFRVGAVLFSNQAGPLGQTETAAQLLQSWQKKEQ